LRQKKRKGSWGVLSAMMIGSFAIGKMIAKRFPYLIAPLGFLLKFLAERYEQEIEVAWKWVQGLFIRKVPA